MVNKEAEVLVAEVGVVFGEKQEGVPHEIDGEGFIEEGNHEAFPDSLLELALTFGAKPKPALGLEENVLGIGRGNAEILGESTHHIGVLIG